MGLDWHFCGPTFSICLFQPSLQAGKSHPLKGVPFVLPKLTISHSLIIYAKIMTQVQKNYRSLFDSMFGQRKSLKEENSLFCNYCPTLAMA